MWYTDPTIITFTIALLGIVGMLIFKSREMKGGMQSPISRMGGNTDSMVQAAHDKVKLVSAHANKHTFIAATQWLAAHTLSWLRSIYIGAYHLAHRHPHSKKVIDMVRGKGDVNQNGGASFFLKRISEEKDIESRAEATPVAPITPTVQPLVAGEAKK